jgi:hypothetical protein
MPRPSPISTMDNDFAFDTMDVRIPDILREVINNNPDYPVAITNNLQNLLSAISSGGTIQMLPGDAHDYASWLPQYEEQLNSYQPFNWHACDWFFAETFAYRSLMEAVRYIETGRDPFAPTKREELDSGALWNLLEEAIAVKDDLSALLSFALWGNRIDLSYAPSREHGTAINDDNILVDDRKETLALLDDISHIHIILDNFGTEFAMDLVLVDALLKRNKAVTLHPKMHPTFVSDTISPDFWAILSAMDERVPQLSERLRSAWDSGQVTLRPHPFWNSSYFMWAMPPALKRSLRGTLVILKGDANYRRAVGDAIWETTTPFSDVLSYMHTPVLALRTLKSESVVGFEDGMADHLDSIDEQWRFNGKRGLIQLHHG